MKRIMFFGLMMAILAVSVLPALAGGGGEEMVTVRSSILINGEHQRYMPYAFTVTSVNCGVLQTMELKKSDSVFGTKGFWEKKFIGELAPSGWYRFNVTGADLNACAPIMDVVSEVPLWFANIRSGSFMEVEPEDLGLLVKGGNAPNNFFGLSADDRQFSYELVAMSPGTERSLDSFKNNTHFFSDTGKNIVGAIIADSRGFLKTKVMFGSEQITTQPTVLLNDIPKGFARNPWARRIIAKIPPVVPSPQTLPEDIIVREGDVLVLIRDERIPY